MSKIDLTRFDFYALRFLKSEDVEIMTAEEVGQFVLLMCHAWLGGKAASLPNNPVLLAKYARCERVSEAVLKEWKVGPDGRLYNETLSEEWDAAVGRSAHGMRGAAARWNKEHSPSNAATDAPAMPEHSPSNAATDAPPMVKPSQSNPTQSKTRSVASQQTAGFEDFWELYPQKIAKQDALKAWRKIKADEVPMILSGLHAAIQTEAWQKDAGKFIPHAATWLRGRRWEDEVTASPATRKSSMDPRQSSDYPILEVCR